MSKAKFFLSVASVLLLASSFQSCGRHVAVVPAMTLTPAPSHVASPRAVVYKTRGDYQKLVPVILSADRKSLVAYPAVSDVSHLPVPTPLANGWLLDNRGITAHVAFTTWTYEEYAALPATPSAQEIMDHVLDTNPLLEAWLCAPRSTYQGRESELLTPLIEAGFPGCERLK